MSKDLTRREQLTMKLRRFDAKFPQINCSLNFVLHKTLEMKLLSEVPHHLILNCPPMAKNCCPVGGCVILRHEGKTGCVPIRICQRFGCVRDFIHKQTTWVSTKWYHHDKNEHPRQWRLQCPMDFKSWCLIPDHWLWDRKREGHRLKSMMMSTNLGHNQSQLHLVGPTAINTKCSKSAVSLLVKSSNGSGFRGPSVSPCANFIKAACTSLNPPGNRKYRWHVDIQSSTQAFPFSNRCAKYFKSKDPWALQNDKITLLNQRAHI